MELCVLPHAALQTARHWRRSARLCPGLSLPGLDPWLSGLLTLSPFGATARAGPRAGRHVFSSLHCHLGSALAASEAEGKNSATATSRCSVVFAVRAVLLQGLCLPSLPSSPPNESARSTPDHSFGSREGTRIAIGSQQLTNSSTVETAGLDWVSPTDTRKVK